MPPNHSLPIRQAPPSAHAGAALAACPKSPGAASLYIHVPFCFHKCHYCDFYSIVDSRDRQSAFVDRLELELRALAPWAARPLHTIFVGGGTPSLLRPDLWRRLLASLAGLFDLSRIAAGEGEFTVECNPETVTPELMSILASGGVDRVSIGAQSFNEAHLKALERRHDPDNVARAVELARAAGIRRQSLDLIFAIPGQTPAQWRSDLETALSLNTEHISCYALTYEPNTAMTARLKRGEFQRADESLEADLFLLTRDLIRAGGLDAYEVSNFARAGAECRHNLAYWRQEEWLAAGPSASAHVGGRRWKNAPRLDDYLDRSFDGFSTILDFEEPDAGRALSERLMTGLRLREGLDSTTVLAAAGAFRPRAPARLSRVADRLRRQGWLQDSDRWTLTDSGILIADRIVVDFMAALDP
ncbi:Heme chaperone HemW [Phycisphaerales bacterium]|nr:Heme chaperone HemW [Phycisphaerales bacterium]